MITTYLAAIVAFFKNIKNILLAAAIVVPLLIAGYFYYQNKSIKEENVLLTNNNKSLTGIISGDASENYSLRMSISEMKASNDSLTLSLSKKIKTSGFKEKNISNATVVVQSLTDTAYDTITVAKDCSFDRTVYINKQTKSRIVLSKSKTTGVDSLVNILDIKDSLYFIRGAKTPYKNEYKNFLVRLLHFDFKRDALKAYKIEHSNDAIKNDGVRVIDIEE
jgi:hypothetical protein